MKNTSNELIRRAKEIEDRHIELSKLNRLASILLLPALQADTRELVDELKTEYIEQLELHNKQLEHLAEHGMKFAPKRQLGATSTTTKYINKLSTDNPDKKAKELLQIADRKIIGTMNVRTFCNHVSKARNTNH